VCGNQQIDGNETCDSGEGCTLFCTCNEPPYRPYSPPRPACQLISQPLSDSTVTSDFISIGNEFSHITFVFF
jgi:hypothetical protein